jgi:sigma-B regulation protein RsbU (phosphoserine phosphatase)
MVISMLDTKKCLHIYDSTKQVEELDTKGVPLGILEVRKSDYEEKQGKLAPGDILSTFN